MIWKRRMLKPTVATQPTGSLWCVKLGPFQRNVDPTHHMLITLGEIALMFSLTEIGDPMIGCATAYAGVMFSDTLKDADLTGNYRNLA